MDACRLVRLHGDFRNFRLNRINELTMLDETFQTEPGRTLEDFYHKVCEPGPSPLST